jgi:hypothetical protein
MAEELARTLKGFGEARSSIVAPTTPQDLERARHLAVVGKVVGGESPAVPAAVLEVKPAAAPAVAAAPSSCKQCGAGMDAGDRFCGDCGTAA